MKRFHFLLLGLLMLWFVLIRFYPWCSTIFMALAMLASAYYFYKTRLEGVETRNRSMEKEIGELQLQLDSSILKESRAHSEAETAKRIKRQMLATINHEIRTPMNGMLGMTLLLRDTDLTREQRDCIETIRYCGENLIGTVNGLLVDDLLNFSKTDQTGEELEKKDFDLRTCVSEVLTMFGGKMDKGGPELSYCIAPDVPEQLNGDRKRLSQVLMSLVDNAVRHTAAGEIGILVRSSCAVKNGRILLEFEIRDTGCGIPANKLDLLFSGITAGEVAGPADGEPKGLGLVLCKKLVELMGGNISASSQPGQGSAFTFSAFFHPATKPKHSPVNPGPADKGKKIIITNINKKPAHNKQELSEAFSAEFPLRILVAEDNEINQKLILRILGKLGYDASLARNGKEVLEFPDLPSYELILMDVQMPEMDGLEATRMVRLCLEKQPVIIAMTANALDGDQDNCLQAGMDDYISKPVELSVLIGKLEQWGGAIKAKRVPLAR